MKKILIIFLLVTSISVPAFSQLSVGYHQSALPFAEVAYEINEKIVPSARLGMNTEFGDLVLELAGLYQFSEKDDYEIYAGAGLRFGYGLTTDDGLFIVLPVGVNFFPFPRKGFGFHIEAAPMLGEDSVLRGSFGIRYRFNKQEDN